MCEDHRDVKINVSGAGWRNLPEGIDICCSCKSLQHVLSILKDISEAKSHVII